MFWVGVGMQELTQPAKELEQKKKFVYGELNAAHGPWVG
jgi:hypothetical protein